MGIDPAIYLDPAIRNWVVIPLVAVMVLVGICRHYVMELMKTEKLQDKEELGYHQTLARSGRLAMNGHWLRKESFFNRKSFFTNKQDGVLRKKVRAGPPNPMTNPDGMMGMMKNNMAFMIPNMGMMAFVSYFFSGFVVVKIPFPLTSRFKMMCQRGIDLGTLEVSYVSSLSWYFLVMFGLSGFFNLVLGAGSGADEARMMQAQMGMGGGVNMQFDPAKAFTTSADSLDLVPHSFILEDVEKKLLGKKYPSSANGGAGAGNASGRLNPMDRLRSRGRK